MLYELLRYGSLQSVGAGLVGSGSCERLVVLQRLPSEPLVPVDVEGEDLDDLDEHQARDVAALASVRTQRAENLADGVGDEVGEERGEVGGGGQRFVPA